jgi:hypothetical protein
MTQINEKLIGVMLNDKNYHSWVRQITFFLTDRDKIEYITGEMSILVPALTGAPIAEKQKN